ncbi:MAG: hypothetical protein AVO34_02260 [Firmicutes bacterium ML8_F2]|jgi:hypothetical protein|nr:MAG: hypothetical protein AVO34_02260 [Firmicutes bacterium ML8_F2]
MLPEKWENLVGDIKDNFEVREHQKEHSDEQGGTDTETIVFKGPLGKTKLEFITRPVVLDKKTIYSGRIGSETKVEYIYSQDEKSYKLNAYKWSEAEDSWAEINTEGFHK